MEDQYFKEQMISEKGDAEKLRERNEELESLLEIQRQLLLVITHDLRNSFNSILGFSGLLQERCDQFDLETQQFIHSIHSQANLTFNQLERLTEWAKAQSGSFHVRYRKIDLSELVKLVLDPYAAAAARKNISIEHTDGNVNSLYTDPEIIGLILANFLSNAIKFTCSSGTINIYSVKSDGQVEITVADNGVGMSQKKINNLFRVGKEYSCAGTANENGSGVGLSLCKELAARLNGHIQVESELGTGSKFTVSFPYKSKETLGG